MLPALHDGTLQLRGWEVLLSAILTFILDLPTPCSQVLGKFLKTENGHIPLDLSCGHSHV